MDIFEFTYRLSWAVLTVAGVLAVVWLTWAIFGWTGVDQ